MSASDSFETTLLQLLFNNTALPNIGDAPGLQPSAAAGSLFVSLHTADPGEAGTQLTNETAYSGYARVAVARNAGGWTVSGNNASNTAAVTWPLVGVTGTTVTHFGIGVSAAGAGSLLFSGPLTLTKVFTTTDQPIAAIGDIDTNAD
jgi:hypothetical protein